MDRFFLNTVSVNELQITLASELIERDLLRMHDFVNMWQNLKIWQIILMGVIFLFQTTQLVFGTPSADTDSSY